MYTYNGNKNTLFSLKVNRVAKLCSNFAALLTYSIARNTCYDILSHLTCPTMQVETKRARVSGQGRDSH